MKVFTIALLSIFFLASTPAEAQQPQNKYEAVGDMYQVSRFYEDGTLQEKGTYNKDGVPHGEWVKYSEEGEVIAEAFYVNGKKEGKWLIWTADGNHLYEVNYQDNYLVKSHRWKIEDSNYVAAD